MRRGPEPPLILRPRVPNRGSRARFGRDRREDQSSSGAFSDAGSSSSVRVFAAGFGLVAVARFLGFFVAASTGGASFVASAGPAASFAAAFVSGFVSFFSYSSTKRFVLRSEASRRSATTRNFETNHFSSVLQTSGRWISALPPFRSSLN